MRDRLVSNLVALVALIGAGNASLASAHADHLPAVPLCIRSDEIVAYLTKTSPRIGVSRLSGKDALRFMIIYNAQPPATHFDVDEVLITRSPEAPDLAQIGLFKNGCLFVKIVIRRWALDGMVAQLGQDA